MNHGQRAGRLAAGARRALGCAGLGLALSLTACGGDDREARLLAASQAMEEAQQEVDAAAATVEQRRAEVEDARRELAAAEKELAAARDRLAEARARVDADATDPLVFRSVQRRLLEDEALDGLAISAQVQSGVVTLTGAVPDTATRQRAVEIARGTPGVTRVADRIRIQRPASPVKPTPLPEKTE